MSEVLAAARALEQRGGYDGVPFERYTQELWSLIDQRLPGFGPSWAATHLLQIHCPPLKHAIN